MTKDNDSQNKWLLLTGARVFGIIFSILIPMYLGRKLSVATYGTYKQIMLVFWFSQVALNLGMDDSAYYFLRWDPKRFPLYSINALVFNLAATGLLWAAMVFFAGDIAHLVNNQELGRYMPLLGLLLLTTVSSMQIEGILIGMNRFNERLAVEIGMELLKSLSIICAFFFFNSIDAVLIMLSALMSVRLVATIVIILSYKKKESLRFSEAPQFLISQLKFGLPLGISRILQNVLNMENFFISSFFNLAQFTYYSVGCFENPLVNAARTSMYEITNIEMIDAMKHDGPKAAVKIWKNMSRKLFLIIIPFAIYMMLFAKEIIVLVFSEKYLPSVPFFIIFNLYLIAGALNPEPLFRASSKTHLALKLKFVGLILGISFLVLGAYFGGALWALVGKITGVFLMNLAGLITGAKLLDSQFLELFEWKDLFGCLLVSLFLSVVLRLVFLNVAWHPFWILAVTFSAYTLLQIVFLALAKIIKNEEIYLLKRIVQKSFLKDNV